MPDRLTAGDGCATDLTRAEGRYPTPHGDIAVAWRREGDRFVLEIDVPAGTECEVALPPGCTAATLDGVAPGRHVVKAELA